MQKALAPTLQRELALARRQTDELFELVRPDALYERPIPERHRIIFYLGHLEAFDWNLLARRALDIASFHPEFDRLFAFGIDPPEGSLPSDTRSDWPSVEETRRYNRHTREVIDETVAHAPGEMLHAAIEHRLMHAETLAYILHQLPYGSKLAQPAPPPAEHAAPRQDWIEIPAGTAHMGMQQGEAFGWDNEFQPVSVEVPEFAISRYKVTNGEYLEFVRGGGAPPFFWIEREGRWMYRGMFEEIPLPLDCPVYVTKCQAEEYARWRGAALPSEAQFHRAALGAPPSRNTDFAYWDPIPVTADAAPVNAPVQMTGNGWEWTSSLFAPFAGFEPKPYYLNYSEPFFDGAHYVLKGGSPRTAARLLRPSFRNWFRPAYPYIYATFRLVRP
ncbi:MAG TPA: SUMF1/EgtB/PvdO family nonheme iron enzyme [Bryobacteraceae bacterium]|nr:SUMF1/EgtB/PvdO family nonheme iron enzyme [Bryobacteraceae bacterium]